LDTIGALDDDFGDWYWESDLKKSLDPLNTRLWAFCHLTKLGLLSYWVPYARKYPWKVVQDPA
jgi:hypothetical protein